MECKKRNIANNVIDQAVGMLLPDGDRSAIERLIQAVDLTR